MWPRVSFSVCPEASNVGVRSEAEEFEVSPGIAVVAYMLSSEKANISAKFLNFDASANAKESGSPTM